MDFEKGVDEFESEVAKARNKIESIGEKTKEQYQNWKRALSGALNDKQLVIALSILFGFNLFFSGFNTILGGNARGENTVTCACPAEHRAYYRTLVIVTIALWVMCFILTMVWDTCKFWRFVVGKSSSQHHHTYAGWSRGGNEYAKDGASSMLERTIGSFEAGVQAANKIPVQSIFTKTMGMVADTMDMVDEGEKTLHKIDSELKELKENPLECALTKSMSVVDDVVAHRFGESVSSKESELNKLSTATKPLIEKAADIARQDPTLSKVINPLDEKAQEIKKSFVESMLTKSVEDGMQVMSQNPAEVMVSKAVDFVDDKAQIYSAELIAESKELVDTVRQNPTDSLLTGSMNMIGNEVVNENLEGINVIQSTGPSSEMIHDAESLSTSSLLSTVMGMFDIGLQALKQNPDKLGLSEATELVEMTHDNPMMTKTVGLIASTASFEDPATSLLQGTTEMVKQNPTTSADTMTSLSNELLTPDGSLLSTAVGLIDSGTQLMQQNPENSIFTKATEDDSHASMQSKSATNVLPGQGFNVPQAIGENAQSVLANAAKSKIFGKSQINKFHPKRALSLPHSQPPSEVDTNALLRLKHYEDYLWLQFYKVYSVGATLQGDDENLPSFMHIVGGDHTEPDGYETNAENNPLVEEASQNKYNYPETELVEIQNSCDDGDGDEIPIIVIEADFPSEYYKTEEGDADELPIVTNKPCMADEEISYTTSSHCVTKICDTFDTTAANNSDQVTSHHDTNLTASNLDLTPDTSHPSAQAKLAQSNTSLLSYSTLPKSTKSEDLLGSWVHFKPVGLYDESIDEENVVMQVADATCARVSFFLYPLLVLCRLLSQLVLVPLLLFQVLDTYSWICITDDIYCSSVLNQYRLGLDRATLAFTFYCCLLTSTLATVILRWFPCSKYARKAGATCIM